MWFPYGLNAGCYVNRYNDYNWILSAWGKSHNTGLTHLAKDGSKGLNISDLRGDADEQMERTYYAPGN